MTTSLKQLPSTGLLVFPPRRAAALRRTVAPAVVGLLAHSVALIALITATTASGNARTADGVLTSHAPLALTIGALATVTVALGRRLGSDRSAIIAGLAAAALTIVPLTALVTSGILSPSVDPARYLGVCILVAPLALAITLSSLRSTTATAQPDPDPLPAVTHYAHLG